MTLEKKTLLHMVRRARSSCAPNTIHYSFGPITQQAGQLAVLGCLSAILCVSLVCIAANISVVDILNIRRIVFQRGHTKRKVFQSTSETHAKRQATQQDWMPSLLGDGDK